MKKIFTAIAMFAIVALISLPVSAGTLYQQEGTTEDGYPPDFSSTYTGAGIASCENWKYQEGSGSWCGVYAHEEQPNGDNWIYCEEEGSEDLIIECDIEMYCCTTTWDNEIYFHLGNLQKLEAGDLRAYVRGTMCTNNGQYVGISFDGTSKTAGDFEDDGGLTGRIFGGMVGSVDNMGRDISSESFDLVILMSWLNGAAGSFLTPSSFGSGAGFENVLWWNPADAGVGAGSFNLVWSITLEPSTWQADGNYQLDPELVVTPAL